MANDKQIPIALIGHGRMGAILARNLHASTLFDLCLVCDESASPQCVADYPRMGGELPEFFRHYHEVLAREDIAAVVVSTPVDTHFEIARDVLYSGKHILVEKPVTSNISQASELVEISRSRRRALFVDHTLLYEQASGLIKNLIMSGVAGAIESLKFTRVQRGANVNQRQKRECYDELAPHVFSLADAWVIQRFSSCRITKAEGNLVDNAKVVLETDDGASIEMDVSIVENCVGGAVRSCEIKTDLCTIHWNEVRDTAGRQTLSVSGSYGVVSHVLECCGRAAESIKYETGDLARATFETGEVLPVSIMLEQWATAITASVARPDSEDVTRYGREAMRVMQLMQGCRSAIEAGTDSHNARLVNLAQ